MTDRNIIRWWTAGMYLNFFAFCLYGALFITISRSNEDGLTALCFGALTYFCAHQVSKYHYGD